MPDSFHVSVQLVFAAFMWHFCTVVDPSMYTIFLSRLTSSTCANAQSLNLGGSGAGAASGKQAASSDLWYDVAGWGMLFVLGLGIVALSRATAPQTLPPPPPLK